MRYDSSDDFSPLWWIFIPVMNFHHSDIFSSEWWISITGMNINHSDEFLFQWGIFVKEFLFLSSILTIIQSKPQPEFWPSSASACFCYNCFLFNQCLWQNLYNVKWVKSFKCTSANKERYQMNNSTGFSFKSDFPTSQ